VGPDGIARALVHYQIADLIDADIEQICIVVRPGEERWVLDYFQGPGEAYLKHLEKYPDLRQEAAKMRAIVDRLSLQCKNARKATDMPSIKAGRSPGATPFCFVWEITCFGAAASLAIAN